MGLGELAAWQWRDYGRYHQSRRNLLVHIVAVPLFLLGNALILGGLFAWTWWISAAGAALSLSAFAAQGLGHKAEPVPPAPFTGPANIVGRILVEQWVTFPRFVLGGGWGRNLRAATLESRRPAPPVDAA